MDIDSVLHTGKLYLPMGDEVMKLQLECLDKLYDFNQTRPSELDKRDALLKEMFAEIGYDCCGRASHSAGIEGKGLSV